MSHQEKLNGESFSSRYSIGEVIGRGAFGLVRKCVEKKTNREFAVKVIESTKLSSHNIRMLERETKICGRLKHQNIVVLHGFYSDDGCRKLLFDLVTGGELFEDIVERSHYSEEDASVCIEQLIQALAYCHANGVIHRDVKPENVLLASKEKGAVVKLADFGLAVEACGDKLTKFGLAGTPSYIAPEILDRKKYGKAVDMWSCGVVLYILLAGSTPFTGDTQEELFEAIREGSVTFPRYDWEEVTDGAKSLIRRMLDVDVDERMTAEEALGHPWIRARESAASKIHRETTIECLKKFNARRKLKGAILTTMIATAKMTI